MLRSAWSQRSTSRPREASGRDLARASPDGGSRDQVLNLVQASRAPGFEPVSSSTAVDRPQRAAPRQSALPGTSATWPGTPVPSAWTWRSSPRATCASA
jgi:hypothetical protein